MPITDDQMDKLIAMLAESKRLEGLTARELVFEMLSRDAADDPHVKELMERVLPGWQTQFTDEELES